MNTLHARFTRGLTVVLTLIVAVALIITLGDLYGSDETPHPPHVRRPRGALPYQPATRPPTYPDEALLTFLALRQRAQLDDFYSIVAHQTFLATLARTTRGPQSTGITTSPGERVGSSPARGSGSCAGDVACFLPCTRAHESDTAGGYTAVSPGGQYRGAYQFDRQTWDSAARTAGRPDLIGRDPASASAPDQDQLATVLYGQRGNQPWGGRC